MMRTIIEFLADERGATALDYARIAALAVVGLVGAYDIFGQVFHGGFEGGLASIASGFETVVK